MSVTITIITPSLNQGEFIEETIKSVISQEGNFKIDYILMDGGSKDDSLLIIKKYESLLRDKLWPIKCDGISYSWRSGTDNGQADAINKGFALAKGDILGWLNSDDMLLPGALSKVATVDWGEYGLCYGKARWISRDGSYIADYPTFRPDKYSIYFRCMLCQPATYFSRKAFDRIGKLSLAYNFAFDYEYWLRAVFGKEKFKRIRTHLADSRMYFDNKSLANRRASAWEFWKIRNLFYGTVMLNQILFAVYRYIVERKTLRQEKILFEKLGAPGNQ